MAENGNENPKRVSRDASLDLKAWGLGVIGAAIGGVVGWYVFGLLINEGFYALALPGAAIGFGFAALSRRLMIGGGIFSAVAAGVLMLFCEWHHRPWVDDGSLSYFLTHVMDLTLATKLMFALGVALAFFLGKGR